MTSLDIKNTACIWNECAFQDTIQCIAIHDLQMGAEYELLPDRPS